MKKQKEIPTVELPRDYSNKIELSPSNGKRLSLVSDVMFTTMINNENNKQYSAYLLSLILEKNYDYIYNNMRIEKNKLDIVNIKEKGRTTDFICEFDDNLTLIEMNNCGSPNTMYRNYTYMALALANKTIRSNKYVFPNTILVNFNNFAYKGQRETMEVIVLENEKSHRLFTDRLKIVNIYIPNILKKWYTKEELSELEKAILVMVDNKEKFTDLMKGNSIMDNYVKDANIASEDDIILGLYDKEVDMEAFRKAQWEEELKDQVEQRLEECVEQRVEECLEQRVEQRVEECLEQRVEECLEEKSIETARKLLKGGVAIDLIVEAIGLSKKQVEDLNLN